MIVDKNRVVWDMYNVSYDYILENMYLGRLYIVNIISLWFGFFCLLGMYNLIGRYGFYVVWSILYMGGASII